MSPEDDASKDSAAQKPAEHDEATAESADKSDAANADANDATGAENRAESGDEASAKSGEEDSSSNGQGTAQANGAAEQPDDIDVAANAQGDASEELKADESQMAMMS